MVGILGELSTHCVRLVLSFTTVYFAWESFQGKQRIHSHLSMSLDFVYDTNLLTHVAGSTESTESFNNFFKRSRDSKNAS
jgi:hypothetical protein